MKYIILSLLLGIATLSNAQIEKTNVGILSFTYTGEAANSGK